MRTENQKREDDFAIGQGYRVELPSYPGNPAAYVKGEHHVWPVPKYDARLYFVGMNWRSAVLLDGKYQHHLTFDELEDALNRVPYSLAGTHLVSPSENGNG